MREGVARSGLIVQQLKALFLLCTSPPAAFVCIFVAIKPRHRAFRNSLATSENVSPSHERFDTTALPKTISPFPAWISDYVYANADYMIENIRRIQVIRFARSDDVIFSIERLLVGSTELDEKHFDRATLSSESHNTRGPWILLVLLPFSETWN